MARPPLRQLELIVLLAVLSLGDDAYPIAIRDAIEKRSKRMLARAAVFLTLERLEDKGLVTSRFGDPTPVRGGRAKRFFKATAAGITAARRSVAEVTAMTSGVEVVLNRGAK